MSSNVYNDDYFLSKYTPRIYEVIDETTHKYASTSVTGVASSHGGYVSSKVKHHSLQDVWLKDLQSKEEVKWSFGSFNNINIRPGHRLIAYFNHFTGTCESISNLTTGQTERKQHTQVGLGSDKANYIVGFFVNALFAAVLGVITMIFPLFILFALLMMKEHYLSGWNKIGGFRYNLRHVKGLPRMYKVVNYSFWLYPFSPFIIDKVCQATQYPFPDLSYVLFGCTFVFMFLALYVGAPQCLKYTTALKAFQERYLQDNKSQIMNIST